MVQKILQTSSFYTLSIALHVLILLTLLVSVNLQPPVQPPEISASVYFETPPAKPRITKKKPKVTVPKTVSTKKSKITKPKLDSLKSQAFPLDNNVSDSLDLSASDSLDMKGFLRANQLTKKKQPSSLNKNNSSLINNTTKVKQKYNVNPVADSSVKPSDTKQPLDTATHSQQSEVDKLLAKYDDGEETGDEMLSEQWSTRTEKKVFKNSLAIRVSENWILPPVSVRDFEVLVAVLLNKTGQIKNINFLKYASLSIVNVAVERTLRLSEPFEKIPESMLLKNGNYRVVFRFTADQVAN